MLCDICGKNEATIHIKEIIGSEKKTLNICNDCAAKQEKNGVFKFGELDLTEVLFNLEKIGGKAKSAGAVHADPALAAAVCPDCGWTLQKIRESGGLLGCARCYVSFAGPICEALSNVHRGQIHLGKRPGGSVNDRSGALLAEISRLKHRLDELVAGEHYEEAALVRDQLRELNGKLEGGRNEAAGKA